MRKPECLKCIHRDVCTDTLIKLTLIEYGECRHFIHEDDILRSSANIDICATCANLLCKEVDSFKATCKANNYKLYTPDPKNDPSKYIKLCPFCRAECSATLKHNMFCKCSAKFYPDDQIWLHRNSGKVIFEKDT